MKFFNFLSFCSHKKPAQTAPNKFSEFFRNASEEEKKQVFADAARRANKDQRRVYYKIN